MTNKKIILLLIVIFACGEGRGEILKTTTPNFEMFRPGTPGIAQASEKQEPIVSNDAITVTADLEK